STPVALRPALFLRFDLPIEPTVIVSVGLLLRVDLAGLAASCSLAFRPAPPHPSPVGLQTLWAPRLVLVVPRSGPLRVPSSLTPRPAPVLEQLALAPALPLAPPPGLSFLTARTPPGVALPPQPLGARPRRSPAAPWLGARWVAVRLPASEPPPAPGPSACGSMPP